MTAHSDATPSTTAARNADIFQKKITFEKKMGITLCKIAPTEATLKMTVTDDVLNFFGSAHGGAIYTLADAAFAYACNTEEYVTVGASCTMDYLLPAYSGDDLTATASLYAKNGRQEIYHIKITNQNNELIAIFTGKSAKTKTLIIDS
ncbi:hydroxyphenylacetyl-CoA thioesterase PaaI [Kordiimonas pumila]|uniref:Hydroxyphenylacetyl-CoA thioesterase PaaI n=1 Tax=Kordiimonas pumila TaxID=2161677 RepID=A0ABV7D2R2_9PROT|nr:hydroxyphenylacetyl-CoA thioesterase PaaI [Kordiimonas pumila]